MASCVHVLNEHTDAVVPESHRMTSPEVVVAVTVQQSLRPRHGVAKLVGDAHTPPTHWNAPSMDDAQSELPTHREPADVVN